MKSTDSHIFAEKALISETVRARQTIFWDHQRRKIYLANSKTFKKCRFGRFCKKSIYLGNDKELEQNGQKIWVTQVKYVFAEKARLSWKW